MNKITHPIEPEELMAYLDGELPADRATATAAHLGECTECQSLISDLRGVSEALGSWKVVTPELQIPQAIAAARSESKPEPTRNGGTKALTWREILGVRWQNAEWIGVVAVVLLVVVGTVRFIGGNANNVFSQVQPSISETNSSANRDQMAVRASQEVRPPATSAEGKPPVNFGASQRDKSVVAREAVVNGPMIIRTAQLSLITKEFDQARTALEVALKRHRGYVGDLKIGGATGSGRTLNATLRVPADQLDATLSELKALGRVESESQSGQDVTSQYVDLQARLANARNTEQRLTDLLRNRTGKLSDVLEVEQEVDRVRGEIEQMEAERKNMSNQVSYATLNATITEDYKAQLQVVPPSTSTRLSNAAVEGYKSMVDGLVSVALFLLENGPSLLLWIAILFLPARLVWKKARRSFAQ